MVVNTSINMYDTTTTRVHAFGTLADLEPANRAKMTGRYNWYVSDRKAIITAAGWVATAYWDYPSNKHSGTCGRGFPWGTPYANPDVAWIIYSADSSRTTTRSWWGGIDSYYNDVDMFPVCKRT